MYDLFFLSNDEPMADVHWLILQRMQPHAKRVDGVSGILAAHQRCAKQARTTNFFVIDADNEVLDVDFRIQLQPWDRNYVHVWRARNPVNGLVYGWGGAKLFPKKLVLEQAIMPLDMTTNFPLKIMPIVGSITHFNTNPFETWRSAFRECVKLACNDDQESRLRLHTWCSVAHGPFADWCLRGAAMGREYGITNKQEPNKLHFINDWQWLKEKFGEMT